MFMSERGILIPLLATGRFRVGGGQCMTWCDRIFHSSHEIPHIRGGAA